MSQTLSKDEAVDRFFPGVDDTTFGKQFIGSLYSRGFVIVEAQAEPSEERIRTRGAGWGRGRGGEDTTNKEPSEAEPEEFMEKWAEEIENSTIFSDKLGTVDVDYYVLKQMLKGYDKLRWRNE